MNTSSHTLLAVLAANGIDRIFQVPGESFLGILDALADFPAIDVVTCRHEAGAGFMACADGRLTGRPGVVMVSRGPGASNASIALHTAQQDAIPLILIVGQVPKKDLRREAFQEIDYQTMFGSVAKWVVEATRAEQLAELAFKAVRIATAGTPGPVVLVVPEDIQQQQQPAAPSSWVARPNAETTAAPQVLAALRALLQTAQRPLIVAGGAFDRLGGREALLAFAHAWNIPVAVSFRRHDIFPNQHPLYVGDLGLSNPEHQIASFQSSDLILALGTRLGDITSQGFAFPDLPKPRQTLVHCYPDDHVVGLHFAADWGLACDPVALVRDLLPHPGDAVGEQRRGWNLKLRDIYSAIAAWPTRTAADGLGFLQVVQSLWQQAPENAIVCLDAGTFAAPVYRHFRFAHSQRLMAPLSGAMGYGTPAAVASKLRHPDARVVCLVGDGGFMMTGNEMIAAVQRKLAVLFILSNNNCYGSIRVHQALTYPGRYVGTSLFNPDFLQIAQGFGLACECVVEPGQIDAAIRRGLEAKGPYFIEVRTSVTTALPSQGEQGTVPLAGD